GRERDIGGRDDGAGRGRRVRDPFDVRERVARGVGAGLVVFAVVFADQRPGVDADGAGERANVSAHEDVAAAGVVVILLDAPDDRSPDLGALAELVHGKTGSRPSLG